jgi:hypothetical protein
MTTIDKEQVAASPSSDSAPRGFGRTTANSGSCILNVIKF